MLQEVARAAEVEASSIPLAIDGCGVPTFALTLERAAHAFTRLPILDGGDRIVRAMRARPELLRGPLAADVLAMKALDGWAAKGGAEGLFCATSAEGLGLALKVADGAFRAIVPALGHILSLLGLEAPGLGDERVRNSRLEPVGTLRVAVAR